MVCTAKEPQRMSARPMLHMFPEPSSSSDSSSNSIAGLSSAPSTQNKGVQTVAAGDMSGRVMAFGTTLYKTPLLTRSKYGFLPSIPNETIPPSLIEESLPVMDAISAEAANSAAYRVQKRWKYWTEPEFGLKLSPQEMEAAMEDLYMEEHKSATEFYSKFLPPGVSYQHLSRRDWETGIENFPDGPYKDRIRTEYLQSRMSFEGH